MCAALVLSTVLNAGAGAQLPSTKNAEAHSGGIAITADGNVDLTVNGPGTVRREQRRIEIDKRIAALDALDEWAAASRQFGRLDNAEALLSQCSDARTTAQQALKALWSRPKFKEALRATSECAESLRTQRRALETVRLTMRANEVLAEPVMPPPTALPPSRESGATPAAGQREQEHTVLRAGASTESERQIYRDENGRIALTIAPTVVQAIHYKPGRDKVARIDRWQRGPQPIHHWRDFAYDRSGNLHRVTTSEGAAVLLIYNRKGRITKMVHKSLSLKKPRQLTFKYNRLGKPVQIAMQNVGTINIDYDSGGEIKRVESRAGHKMALQVTRAFQALLDIVRQPA